MKVINKILVSVSLVAAAFFTASCVEEMSSALESDMTYGVYFPTQPGTGDIQLSPEDAKYLKFTVRRLVTKGALSVPVTIEAEQPGIFSTTEIYFEEDSPTAELEVYFPSIKQGVTYDCTIIVEGDEYVSKYSKNATHLSFSVTSVKWNKLIGDKGETTGLWRDGVFSQFYSTMQKPNHERAVEIYERDDKPGYYRIYDVYNAAFVGEMFGMGSANAAGVCMEKHYTYIDATDPDKVWIPTFKTGVLLSPNDGALSIGSYVAENEDFDPSISSIYGKLEDGVITFPASSVWLHFGSYGWYSANSFGLHRVVLPGYSVPNVDITLEPAITDERGDLPINVSFGLDVSKVMLHYKKGVINASDAAVWADSLAKGAAGLTKAEGGMSPNLTTIDSSQEYNFRPQNQDEATGEYTVLAVGVDKRNRLVSYTQATFGYRASVDDKQVDLNCGLICSNKYAPEGKTEENTFEVYANGKDIKRMNLGLYEYERYAADSLYYKELLNESELSEIALSQVNGEGLSITQSGLAPGTKYILLVKAYNGYSEKEFRIIDSTKGAWDYRLAYYSAGDIEREKVDNLKGIQEYYGDYTYYAIGAYSNSRAYQGEVTLQPTDRKHDNYPCVKATGLFPFFKKTYKVKNDAMYFYYKGGELYSHELELKSFIYEGMYVYTSVLLLSTEGYAYQGVGGLKATFVKKDKASAKGCIAFVDSGVAAAYGVTFAGFALFGCEDSEGKQPLGYLDVVESMVLVNKADDPNPLKPKVEEEDNEENEKEAKSKLKLLYMQSYEANRNCVELY